MTFQFKFKRFLFYTFSLLLMCGQVGLTYSAFSLLHNHNTDTSFFINWFIPVVLSLIVLFLSLLIGIGLERIGSKSSINIGWGEWLFTLTYYKSFKKVYHSELGYFVICLWPEIETNYNKSTPLIRLYQQGWFRMTYLESFNVEPDYLQESIKEFLDKKYSDVYRKKIAKDELNSKIEKIKKWDGFLDKVGARDEKINQLLK